MRKFDFDNLAELSLDNSSFEDVRFELLSAVSPKLPTLFPLSGPLFSGSDGTESDNIIFGTEEGDFVSVGNLEANQTYNALGGDDSVQYSLNQFNVNTSIAVNGGDGLDLLTINTGAFRNFGSDTLDADNDFGGTIDITNNVTAGDYGQLTISNFERLIIEGGGFGDILRGGSGEDELNDGGFFIRVDRNGSESYGLGGNDELYGMGGDDILIGTGGQDILDGGAGNDIVTSGRNYVQGSSDALTGDSYEFLVISRATIIGGEGDDILTSRGEDTLEGGSGNDTLINESEASVAIYSSSEASDYIVTETAPGEYTIEAIGGTGEGKDTLSGIETIRLGGINGTDFAIDELIMGGGTNLTNGDDTYTASDNEVVYGLDGNDTLTAQGMSIVLNGDGGDDILFDISSANNSNTLNGGTGADTIRVETFGSIANGDEGDDNIIITLEASIANGGDGDDIISATGLFSFNFDMTVDGGSGIDTLIFRYDASQDFNNQNRFGGTLDMSTGMSGGDYFITATNFESLDFVGGGEADIVIGTIGDDIINDGGFYAFFGGAGGFFPGGGGNDTLNGAAGDDIIIGTGGIDVLSGGDGNDIITSGATRDFTYEDVGDTGTFTRVGEANISGGAGNDIINSFGNDTIDAGAGDDIVNFGQSERDTATITDGGTGSDTLSFSNLEALPSGQTLLVVELSSQSYSLRDGTSVLFVDSFINFENITGSETNDVLQGSVGVNTLIALGGDDILQGRDGDDILIGGEGRDTAIYSSGNTIDFTITETAPGEYIVVSSEGTDTLIDIEILRLGGIDYDITALAGGGTITLTAGNDIYSGPAVNVIVNALDGDDIIDGGAGNNTLNGDAGDDTLISLGNDILNGGTGNDLIELGGNIFDAATATDGGAGIDTISFSTLAQLPSGNLFLVIDLQGQAYSVRDGGSVLYVDQFSNFENATGSEFNDLLQGDAGANILMGLAGDDNLQGRDGDDIIDGGAGADIFNGGAGSDIASYASALTDVEAFLADAASNMGDAAGDSYIDIENLTGSDFDDVLGGDANANIINGGAGFDIASYSASSAAIVFDGLGLLASEGDIADDTLLNIEAIRGTNFNDRFFGDNGASTFYGGEGADRLFGRNGDDELFGEGGNDIILAGRDNDLLDGGDGNDQLRGNEGDDTLLGGNGNDALAGGAGADVLDGGVGIDRVEYTFGTNAGVIASLADASINTGDAAGDSYIDIENLFGTSFSDTLYGDAGDNRIDGRVGDDVLFGGDGNDFVIGGAGDDVLNGENGNDLLLGQAGVDIYQFGTAHGSDRILIYVQSEDLIEFTETVFDFSDLSITQDGAHVNIDTAEGRIIVNNSLVSDFTSDDFIFATPPPGEELGLIEQDMIILAEVDMLF